MDILVYVLIAVALVVGAYFLFFRKGEAPAPELEAAPKNKALEKKSEPAEKLPAKKEGKAVAPVEKAAPKEQPKKAEPATAETAERKQAGEAAVAETKEGAKGAEAAEEKAPLVAKAIEPASAERHARDVEGLRKGLGKSRSSDGFFGRLAKLITGHKEINPEIVDELEEVLITSDVGVQTTSAVLERIRGGLGRKELGDSEKIWEALRGEAKRILNIGEGGLTLKTKPTVVLMVGVNGSGKTTTIGKLATHLKAQNKKVVLAAGDTFRAAAVQQLEVWGKRVGCEVIKGKDGADPSAVIFDAVQKAAEMGADVVLADTAGRLHTKTPLMDELKKVAKTMGKAMQGAPHETWLVIDSTTGQNAVAQSRQFAEALPLSGIVLTKLDGTAKGGVVLGICDELKIPVRYIGIGERADDLRVFDADEFVEAMLGGSSEEIEAA